MKIHADFGRKFPSRTLWRGPTWNCPLQALCCAPRLPGESTFRGGEKGEKAPREGEGVECHHGDLYPARQNHHTRIQTIKSWKRKCKCHFSDLIRILEKSKCNRSVLATCRSAMANSLASIFWGLPWPTHRTWDRVAARIITLHPITYLTQGNKFRKQLRSVGVSVLGGNEIDNNWKCV